MFNPQTLKSDFPILQRQVHNNPLVYLDNAATSQKPQAVIDAITTYYQTANANVHRGIHALGDESTRVFHTGRQTIAHFLGAQPQELVLVRNTTEGLNQVAATWGEEHILADDVLLTTQLEHHSNLVPWQQLAQRKQAKLYLVPVTSAGELDLQELARLLKEHGQKVKLLTFAHVSNTLGTHLPLAEIVQIARSAVPEITIVVDGAQAAPHVPVQFGDLDVDFYVCSAHKMLGPMGIGALLVKEKHLSTLSPFLFGGGMIREVTNQNATFSDDLEERFTAGTPDVASIIGWAAACTYLERFSASDLHAHDQALIQETLTMLSDFPQITVIGPQAAKRVGSVAFLYEGVHAHDVGQILDSVGVAVRSGHHCTMPLHHAFGWPSTVRVSFQLYNTLDDIAVLRMGLKKVATVFHK